MVFSYWKVEYATPYVNYNYDTFQSSSKGRFYMLSDFVFQLVHRYCFKRLLYGYMKYVFTTRIKDFYFTEVHGRINFLEKNVFFYSKRLRSFLNNKKTYQNPLSTSFYYFFTQLRQYYMFVDFIFTIKYTFLTSVRNTSLLNRYFYLKKKDIQSLKSKFLLYKRHYMEKYVENKNIFNILITKFNLLYSNIYVNIFITIHLKKNNRLYVEESVSHFSGLPFYTVVRYYIEMFHRTIGFDTGFNFLSFDKRSKLNKYIKNVCSELPLSDYFTPALSYVGAASSTFELNELKSVLKKKRGMKRSNKRKDSFRIYRIQLRERRNRILELRRMKLKSYLFFLQTSVRQLNSVFFRYFFLNKINNLKKVNTLNYSNLLNVKYKKDLLISLKTRLHSFYKKLNSITHSDRKYFYSNLNRLLETNRWFLGAGNKVKFFRYLTRLVGVFSQAFNGILYMNSPLRSKRFSFFYNPHSIRKQLLYTLGKKRYIEEFLLPRKHVIMLQSILMYYYGFKAGFLKTFYNSVKHNMKIIYIKDLITLVEYNHLVFFRRYLTFSLDTFNSGVVLTGGGVRLSLSKFRSFFISDIIEICTITDRFFLFFNAFFYISPILYKRKHTLLYNMYRKVYICMNGYKETTNNLYSHSYIHTSLNRYFSAFVTFSNNTFSEKSLFKICTVFLLKYNMLDISILQYRQNVSVAYSPSLSLSSFFGKSYHDLLLFDYKISNVPKILGSTKDRRRKIRFMRRKSFFSKKIIYSITRLYSYVLNPRKKQYKKYMGLLLDKTFSKKSHSVYFYKKLGFLARKPVFNKVFYDFVY